MTGDTATSGDRRADAGTALIEIVVLGFAIVAIVLPTVSMVVALADARAHASAMAHDAAVSVARHGHEPKESHAGTIDVTIAGDRVDVVATVDVTVVTFFGLDVAMSVSERASMSASPYRSGR